MSLSQTIQAAAAPEPGRPPAGGANRSASPLPQTAWRAARLVLRYPFQVAASIVLALLAAVCWGGNIAAVYPVLEVTFQGKSLPEWADGRIAESTAIVADLDAQLDVIRSTVPADASEESRRRQAIEAVEARRAAEARMIVLIEWIRPHLVRWLPEDPFPTVVCIVACIIASTVLKNACVVGGLLLTSRISQRMAYDLRREFFDAVLRTDVRSLSDRGTKKLWMRFVKDVPQLSQGMRALLGRAVGEPLKIAACLAGAAAINWRLLLMSLVLAPVAAWLIGTLARRMRNQASDTFEKDSQLNDLMFETLQGLPIVQAYTMEPAERVRFHAASERSRRQSGHVALLHALSKPAVEILGIAIICTAILAGAHLVLNQETHVLGLRMADRPPTPSALLVFFGMLVGIYDPIRKLGEVFPQISAGFSAAERLFPVLDARPRIVESPQAVSLPRPHRELVLDDVHFRYREERPVLKGVSLTIPFGQALAIVGPNGCGKSTLANLIPRLLDPDGGSVRIDGVDLREIRLSDLRQRIAIVTQHAHLFDDTIFQNILCGRPDASREEAVEAARQAHAHDLILSHLADGYETMVGQGGVRLSGGQQQRIALARALLRDPEILILDEPTSQIDVGSEQIIQRALSQSVGRRTMILITHRLSLLELAHRIVVLKDGAVLAAGTHGELLESCDQYRRLHLPRSVA